MKHRARQVDVANLVDCGELAACRFAGDGEVASAIEVLEA